MDCAVLLQLTVTHYAIARALEHTFSAGMTAITGETGAGKSILLDALGLALGDRADVEAISPGQERADICACFDIAQQTQAQLWLQTHDFPAAADDAQCLLKRVIAREGRSRAYINGQPATLQQLRELGELLIDIHSQHEHQSLLHKDTHRRLLDEFGNHAPLTDKLHAIFAQWQQQAGRLRALRELDDERNARVQLLQYQVDELDKIAAQPLEAEQLDAEHKQLTTAESLIESSAVLLQLCTESEEFNVRQALAQALHLLQHSELAEQLPSVADMLTSACIQVDEAVNDIQRYRDRLVINPERLQQVEQRQSLLFDVARKHKIAARDVPALHQQLSDELRALTGGADSIAALDQSLTALEADYQHIACQLSKKRQKAAKSLAARVREQLRRLKMEHCFFEVALHSLADMSPAAHGLEHVEFLISTQPDAPPRALAKIASGGELSRISLAIQVVTALTSRIPTLVFDEVDVGIGGSTALVVGDLLRQLGERGQVLCVTHQAQVAARAHQHLRVQKHLVGKQMETQLQALESEDRIAEIARMIGGERISAHSRAHAEEMLMP